MKKHLKDNWTLYIYLLWQIPQVILWYKGIIRWNWVYVWMPSLIMITLLIMTFILGFCLGIKEDINDNGHIR